MGRPRSAPHLGAAGLQKQVLSLYRRSVQFRVCRRRAIAAKQQLPPEKRAELQSHVRAQFDAHAALPRKEIDRVEWLLRNGERKLKTLRLPGFVGVAPPPS